MSNADNGDQLARLQFLLHLPHWRNFIATHKRLESLIVGRLLFRRMYPGSLRNFPPFDYFIFDVCGELRG